MSDKLEDFKGNRIVLVDDHKLMIDGLRNMLVDNNFVIIAEASDTVNAMEIINRHAEEIDFLITDIQLPGDSGLELIRNVKKAYSHIKIIVLSMHDERTVVMEAVSLGVNAYLLKNLTQSQFLHAINIVKSGKFFISEELSYVLADKVNIKSVASLLSNREMEILRLIAMEYSNKQIAEALFISERTVESHRKNIFTKTNTKSVVGLIQFAIKNELI